MTSWILPRHILGRDVFWSTVSFLNNQAESDGGMEEATIGPDAAASGKPAPGRRRALAGLLVRKEGWALSVRGKLLVFILLVAALFGLRGSIYSWLAVTHRVPAEYLVVEGWAYNSGFKQAISEFNHGGYRLVLTSGCPVENTSQFGGKVTYADWGAASLIKLGLPKNLVRAVPCRVERRDRTYDSALAVRNWFNDHHIPVAGINVLTMGPHARRTWLLFQKAFGDEVKVGIISVPYPGYDPSHWWRYSEGVRDVVGEGIAYLYVRFFFWPGSTENEAGRNNPRITRITQNVKLILNR